MNHCMELANLSSVVNKYELFAKSYIGLNFLLFSPICLLLIIYFVIFVTKSRPAMFY